jgi:sulfur carrier protein
VPHYLFMHITLNGTTIDFEGDTLAALLAARGIAMGQGGVAVAVNGSVVPRSHWAAQKITAGDRVEIVRAIAGG